MKKRRKAGKSTKTISYNYDATGYLIQLCDAGEIIDEYRAGNCRQDSITILDPDDEGAIAPEEIRRLAAIETKRLADEHGIPLSHIEVDDDIVVSETEDELAEVG